MEGITIRCQMCGKTFIVTEVNKDFKSILRNPKYPFHCESCTLQVQLEARHEKYYELFDSDSHSATHHFGRLFVKLYLTLFSDTSDLQDKAI